MRHIMLMLFFTTTLGAQTPGKPLRSAAKKAAGWQLETHGSFEPQQMLSVSSEERHAADLLVSCGDDGPMVAMMVIDDLSAFAGSDYTLTTRARVADSMVTTEWGETDLDAVGVLSRYLPEWEAVRNRPQRAAYHVYTVDRHLLEAAGRAAPLVRTVHRPDLLLIGTLVHDIGKCGAADHTAEGVRMVDGIARRMGFDESDVETLCLLVRDHLLLAETATRRDLEDPATVDTVARRVETVERLELLAALTEADALATGPTAWSGWKADLVGGKLFSAGA